ncbi:tRNA (Guanine37-N(1)-) methyltransferase [Rubrobacter xylanophilus DSM 9941]|uniref:tRNA (guanine-N(1)-)-methyltransferase n=1 Tax=Rubrobacter xylanophilus (strain DSM 9941 / JCM 11954 / NBRC 16129 / PRD-1) TaxID=266117 RepID=Q1AW74_RUBXD|nr:tRNA (guanosine(37)-N1)-methyltransferase TrmD [Rubrobacter xylanophilus]ABG04354.1 tRNA (Guanine37-N(1)-) methyltransferase [Rubrobacter xylanophilus DSM 9941]
MRNIDVFCVFPRAVEAAVRVGVVGRAIERGLVGLRCFDLREYSPDGRIDDMPYGGGPGMVVRVDVVARALEEVYGVPARRVREGRRVVLTEAWGRVMDQRYVDEVAAGPDVTVVCGRYGGVDERVRTELATETVSLGDFVLSGGEIVAAALADAAFRRIEGVLGNRESLLGESFSEEGVLGPPQYTRPAVWEGVAVPEVLLSGDHGRIKAWREEQGRLRAARRGR